MTPDSSCTHHWEIPQFPPYKARCKRCGARREFAKKSEGKKYYGRNKGLAELP